MKKFIIPIAAALFASATLVNATEISALSSSTVVAQEKVEIRPEELPDAVHSALAAEPYNAWQIQRAFMVPDGEGGNYYEISLSKGEELKTAHFDKDGKVIEKTGN